MKIEGRNGKFYDVDLSGKCTCSGNRQRGVCSHSSFFIDIEKNGATKNHYEIKQAFAAEIRRGHDEAVNWGRLICKAKGREYFARLCRQMIISETRNLSAMEESFQTNDSKKLITLLHESPKLHENPYYRGSHLHLIEGFYRYQSAHYRKYPSNAKMLREMIDEAREPETAYAVAFFMEDNRQLESSFVRMLYDKAVDDKNWQLIRFLELGQMHTPEAFRFAMELAVRHWHPEAERKQRDFASPEFYYPILKTHHLALKNLKPVFEKHHDKIRPNKRIAREVRCDLRFIDSWFGFFWRFLGAQQFGVIEDLEWNDVTFSVNDWLSAQILDKRYYPTLYQNILLAG